MTTEEKPSRLLIDRQTQPIDEVTGEVKPYRTFCCVEQPNTSFLIVEGRPEDNLPIMTPEGPIPRSHTQRVGDKYVTFVDGLFATNDEESIIWCERNYPKVMDMEKPETEMLVAIARMQVTRDDYEPEIKGNLVQRVSGNLEETIKAAIDRAVDKAKAETEEELKSRGWTPPTQRIESYPKSDSNAFPTTSEGE